MEGVADPHECPGAEGPQIEAVVVEQLPTFRVRGEHDLESAIEPVAIDHVGADPAARPVTGLEDHDIVARGRDVPRGCQSGQPCSNDSDAHRLFLPAVVPLCLQQVQLFVSGPGFGGDRSSLSGANSGVGEHGVEAASEGQRADVARRVGEDRG